MDLLETYGPQDDCGRSSVSPLHPIKQSVLNKGLQNHTSRGGR